MAKLKPFKGFLLPICMDDFCCGSPVDGEVKPAPAPVGNCSFFLGGFWWFCQWVEQKEKDQDLASSNEVSEL